MGRESGLEGRLQPYVGAAIPCACSVRPTIPHSQLPLTHYVPAVGWHILCAALPPLFESPAPQGACLISRHLEGWEPRLCGVAGGVPAPPTLELSAFLSCPPPGQPADGALLHPHRSRSVRLGGRWRWQLDGAHRGGCWDGRCRRPRPQGRPLGPITRGALRTRHLARACASACPRDPYSSLIPL